jgi:hypothetical protein
MNMNFELYEGGEVEWTRGRVHVTLNKHCHLFFSRRAIEALGGCEGVALLFDRRPKVIGVMPARPGQKHSYTLRAKRGMGGARLITAKNFCKTYGIATAETIAFEGASVPDWKVSENFPSSTSRSPEMSARSVWMECSKMRRSGVRV